LRVSAQVRDFIKTHVSSGPFEILCFGAHKKEVTDLNHLMTKEPAIANIHQPGLSSVHKKRGTVFHELSTLNLGELKKKHVFDLVIAQNSFYTHGLFTQGLLHLYRVLKPGGKAILYYANDKNLYSHFLDKRKELDDLHNHFSYTFNFFQDGGVAVLTKKPLKRIAATGNRTRA
jgi:SAM-dependent methyltransferase